MYTQQCNINLLVHMCVCVYISYQSTRRWSAFLTLHILTHIYAMHSHNIMTNYCSLLYTCNKQVSYFQVCQWWVINIEFSFSLLNSIAESEPELSIIVLLYVLYWSEVNEFLFYNILNYLETDYINNLYITAFVRPVTLHSMVRRSKFSQCST